MTPVLAAVLLFGSTVSEPGDWAGQRGAAALRLDTEPGNADLWLTYCQSAWRSGDRSVVTACAEQAAGAARHTAAAMRSQTELPKDNVWALRVLLERAEQRGDHGAARQYAQSLFEAESDNSWALEKAVHAALRSGDGPMAIALATRGSERFGEPFGTLTRRAEALRDQRSGYHWILFSGILILLIVLLRKSRRHAAGGNRRVGTRREVPTRQSHALDSPRRPRR